MGGVLIDYNLKRTVSEYFPQEDNSLIMEKVFLSQYWRDLDSGYITFDEAIPEILKELPVKYHKLISEMVSDFYPYMPTFDDMFSFISRIKNTGYKVYLLSNATPRAFDHYFDIPALSLMDGLFISALYKMSKPDKIIYTTFCKQFNLIPDECFFIDDVKANIDGAKSIGMKGYVFNHHNLDVLEKELNKVNVVF